MKSEKKERLIDMFTMKIDGKTYKEIGEKYGITKQAVEDELGRAMNKKNLILKHSFERRKLAEWITLHNLNVKEFAEMIGVADVTVRNFLNGCNINSKTIFKIVNITGLTLQDLTEVENESKNNQ
jgi:transposase